MWSHGLFCDLASAAVGPQLVGRLRSQQRPEQPGRCCDGAVRQSGERRPESGALTSEAKKVLAAEVDKKAKIALVQEGSQETVDSNAQDDIGQKALDPESKRRKKEAIAEAAGKTVYGSVQAYLEKPNEETGMAAKKDEQASGFVKPKPKHRPVSLVHTVNMSHGTLEIFTRFRPKEPQAEVVSTPPRPAPPARTFRRMRRSFLLHHLRHFRHRPRRRPRPALYHLCHRQ